LQFCNKEDVNILIICNKEEVIIIIFCNKEGVILSKSCNKEDLILQIFAQNLFPKDIKKWLTMLFFFSYFRLPPAGY
jgi:hypothetical protein